MKLKRCAWVNLKNPLYVKYHDEEWGRPLHDDQKLFELLVLETFQAGLSWECVLNKREAFRAAYDRFSVDNVASYTALNFVVLPSSQKKGKKIKDLGRRTEQANVPVKRRCRVLEKRKMCACSWFESKPRL